MTFYLKPSEIRYTQDSIKSTFGPYGQYASRHIGESLDDLLTGKCTIDTIPIISVVKMDNKWYSADNRRLWVFRKAEELGECKRIPVTRSYYIPEHKFTTDNDGLSIDVRRNPGGSVWRRWKSRSRDVGKRRHSPEIIRKPFQEISTNRSRVYVVDQPYVHTPQSTGRNIVESVIRPSQTSYSNPQFNKIEDIRPVSISRTTNPNLNWNANTRSTSSNEHLGQIPSNQNISSSNRDREDPAYEPYQYSRSIARNEHYELKVDERNKDQCCGCVIL